MVDPVSAAAPLVRLAGVELTLESGAGAVNILRGVDLEIAAGDTVAVTGASGSGKSTLIRCINGLEIIHRQARCANDMNNARLSCNSSHFYGCLWRSKIDDGVCMNQGG